MTRFAKYSDIIESMPWECGDKDCEAQWHLANYWINAYSKSRVEYTVDWYADGDHEPADDVPEPEDIQAEWAKYYCYVAKSGNDPIGQFAITREHKIKRKWDFQASRSLGPKVYFLVKPAALPWSKAKAPQAWGKQITEFFDVTDMTLDELVSTGTEITWKAKRRWQFIGKNQHRLVYGQVQIEESTPRSKSVLERELKRLARKSLKRQVKP